MCISVSIDFTKLKICTFQVKTRQLMLVREKIRDRLFAEQFI